jgi:NTP pyrophosphatase (non-canonical NTP hydrolase)
MNLELTSQLLTDVLNERQRQHAKWGEQNHGVADWILILSEEFGEAAKAANEVRFRNADPEEYRKELIQTAAVCINALDALSRGYK